MAKIFIVEDDPWYGALLEHHLSLNPDYEVSLFTSGKEVLSNLYKQPDVICIDFNLPDVQGMELLEKIHKSNHCIPIIVISGQEDIEVAVNLLKNGASDYIIKGEHAKEQLWKSILNLLEKSALKKEVSDLKEQLGQKYEFENSIIGKSKAIKSVFHLIEKATKSTINVTVTGETGTGKELVAKAIHYNSNRSKKPFVAVNMAAIPAELLESELFGHEKGAFTGANATKIGKFEAANGGTLFLDEIAELDLVLQTKLLRALQEREIVRVGGHKPIKFDARLITATHKDLLEEVKNENFREDLFYRVAGLPIELPALRERGDDIIIISKHFIDAYCKDNKIETKRLTEEAIQKLLAYNFPGNIRELKAMIELACVLSEGQQITEDDIHFRNTKGQQFMTNEEKTLRAYTCDIVKFYLKKYHNNVVEVAKKLDVGKSTIYNMLKSGEVVVEK